MWQLLLFTITAILAVNKQNNVTAASIHNHRYTSSGNATKDAENKRLFLFHWNHCLSASPPFICAGSQKAFAVSLQFLAHIPATKAHDNIPKKIQEKNVLVMNICCCPSVTANKKKRLSVFLPTFRTGRNLSGPGNFTLQGIMMILSVVICSSGRGPTTILCITSHKICLAGYSPGARPFKVSTSCENGVFPHRCSA